jgi:hypothetical protein
LENVLGQIAELRRSLKDLTDEVNAFRQAMAQEDTTGRIPDSLPLDHRRYTWKKNMEPLGSFIKENLVQDSKTTEACILAETDGYVRFRKKLEKPPRSFLLESQIDGEEDEPLPGLSA